MNRLNFYTEEERINEIRDFFRQGVTPTKLSVNEFRKEFLETVRAILDQDGKAHVKGDETHGNFVQRVVDAADKLVGGDLSNEERDSLIRASGLDI